MVLNKNTLQCEVITDATNGQIIDMPILPSSQSDCKNGEVFNSVLRACIKTMYTCQENQFYN